MRSRLDNYKKASRNPYSFNKYPRRASQKAKNIGITRTKLFKAKKTCRDGSSWEMFHSRNSRRPKTPRDLPDLTTHSNLSRGMRMRLTRRKKILFLSEMWICRKLRPNHNCLILSSNQMTSPSELWSKGLGILRKLCPAEDFRLSQGFSGPRPVDRQRTIFLRSNISLPSLYLPFPEIHTPTWNLIDIRTRIASSPLF